ncbi:hypothetical protein QFC19_003525 [Naganishia cerealis]|uniref:Uncharacterized protein n=1 Tax=Naganishia cerealis TaxID=610337 RepID=A0ACC2W2C6_9TREE|nr:hypothetical protein QFC19_003525 [Naganishia cerealis]
MSRSASTSTFQAVSNTDTSPPRTSLKPPSGFTVLAELGIGGFAVVYKARREADGELIRNLLPKLFALKAIDMRNLNAREEECLQRELNIHASLDHPSIVKFVDVSHNVEQQMLYVILEYCPGGTLSDLIQHHSRNGSMIPENVIWEYLKQLILALNYLHEPANRSFEASTVILHRDIKPENILMSGDQEQVKLADFGLAKEVGIEEWATSCCGTPDFMPPEMCTSNQEDIRTDEVGDIWSLGCVLYEMCTLSSSLQYPVYLRLSLWALSRPLFNDTDDAELKQAIRRGATPCIPGCYSDDLSTVLTGMLATNVSQLSASDFRTNVLTYPSPLSGFCLQPADRPTSEELLKLSRLHHEASSVPSNLLLKEAAEQRAKIDQLEAQVRFLQQQVDTQVNESAALKRDHQEETEFFERENRRLKKLVEAEKSRRERCQSALSEAEIRFNQLQTESQKENDHLRSLLEAKKKAEISTLEKTSSLRSMVKSTKQHPTSAPVAEKALSSRPMVKSIRQTHEKTLPPRSMVRSVKPTHSTSASIKRSASDSSSVSSGNSSDSSTEQSRIPRLRKREPIVTPSVATTKHHTKVNVAAIARAAIVAAAENGKRKLEAFQAPSATTPFSSDLQKRPRLPIRTGGQRHRM